jgi:hypothetical protein
VGLETVSEHSQRALDEADRAVRVVAGAATAHLVTPSLQLHAFALVGDPVDDRPEGCRDGRQAVYAGAALPGGLARQVVDDPGALVQAAGALAERDHNPGAK